jgi:hypothetical protein
MQYQYAPIAFFAYRRPELTLRSLTSLMNNVVADQSELFIFCDAPKTEVDERAVRQVRQVVRSQQWCRHIHITEQATNQGLARSVIDGVTQLVESFGRVIVLEDDLLLSKGFIDYVNRALDRYESVEQVLQISGHMFPVQDLSGEHDAFFMPMVTSWGWATWRRAWRLFDPYATGYERLKKDEQLRNKFNLNSSYPYSTMLLAQMSGKIDSWAIRWWWSVFRAGGVSLFPKYSLIRNIGSSIEATHTQRSHDLHNDPQWSEERSVVGLPSESAVDEANFEQVCKYLSSPIRNSSFEQMTRFVKRLIHRSGVA